MPTKLDRRRKYYIVLDCETATLPIVDKYPSAMRKQIAIAKPLIYDIGWSIIDGSGAIYKKVNYLITEIFSVPQVFNTAYYHHKRPIYLDKISKGEITLTNWNTAVEELLEDMRLVNAVGAYNSMFDFKKAIPFTELYISKVYSADYDNWLDIQKKSCDLICKGIKPSNKTFDKDHFKLRGEEFDLFDIWGLACQELLNTDNYRQFCIDNNLKTASTKFFSTTAESCYRYLVQDTDFEESHTALEDVLIERFIMSLIMKKRKHKFDRGIIYFPFKILGTVEDYEVAQGIGVGV